MSDFKHTPASGWFPSSALKSISRTWHEERAGTGLIALIQGTKAPRFSSTPTLTSR